MTAPTLSPAELDEIEGLALVDPADPQAGSYDGKLDALLAMARGKAEAEAERDRLRDILGKARIATAKMDAVLQRILEGEP